MYKSMKKLILIMALVLTSAGSIGSELSDYMDYISNNYLYSNTNLGNAEIQEIKIGVNDIFKIASGQTPTPNPMFPGYLPQDLHGEYYDMAFNLYNDGYAKKIHLDYFNSQYAILLTTNAAPNVDPIQFWENKYTVLFDDYLSRVKSDPQVCAQEGINATARKCCRGLSQMTQVKKISNSCKPGANSCGDNNECCSGVCNRSNPNIPGVCESATKGISGSSCNKQDDCISGLCSKIDPNEAGTCTAVKQCYKLQTLGGSCAGNQPFCGEGECKKIDKGVLGLGECSRKAQQCSADADCCSDSCSSGKCVEKSICLKCV
jgi:hypothetical protein